MFWDWVLFVFLSTIFVSVLFDFIIFKQELTVNLTPIPNRSSLDLSTPLFASIWSLLLLLPNLAITSRRLRDAAFSPWLTLLYALPGIGTLILLVLSTRRGPQDRSSADIILTRGKADVTA
jgi:uncharacterized membrane protein YhaH (DUF805 family)